MANKRVIVVGQGNISFSELKDEADVATFVTDAQTLGYFVSTDSTAYIPWEIASVKVQDPDDPYTP